MTQEEKAKAYDEAVKRAKAAIDVAADKDLVGGVVKTILPELRESESEDERVRKALINLVCTVGEYYLPKLEARNKMLDYLEKQKEQKPEWSDEDSDNLERVDNYLWMLDDYVGDDCAMPQGKTDKIRGNIQGILSPWLKALPERFNLQPKQEWSEEDERLYKCVLKTLELWAEGKLYQYIIPSNTDRYIDFFKSLKFRVQPQPKQKWSEEDIQRIRKEEYTKGFNDAAFGGKAWKPSEEQMEALDKAISVCMVVVGRDEVAPLKSLLQDLKKRI